LREEGSLGYDGGLVRLQVHTKLDTDIHRQQALFSGAVAMEQVIKIRSFGCKDITKVPAVVEGLLDMHFYDFTFQREREIHIEGHNHPGWNTWTRSNEGNETHPPKNQKEMRKKVIRGDLLVTIMLKLEHQLNNMVNNMPQKEERRQ
jgi:hypothetical protein